MMNYWHNKEINIANDDSILAYIQEELNSFRTKLGISEIGEFEKTLKVVLDDIFVTVPLKNLNYRRQLGLLHIVKSDWITVNHTRLEHSIGVATKCLIVCDILNKKNKDILTYDDILELIIAAAMHDIAHLPISHATERGILTIGKFDEGISHEDRVASFLLSDNNYFKSIKEIIFKYSKRTKSEAITNIISIISYKSALKFLPGDTSNWPKKAITQLLSSELDMDRLDYIIRDSLATNYTPVTLVIDDILQYIKYLTLKPMTLIDKTVPLGEYELCLPKDKLEYAFYFLVARVLMYTNIYFSKDVRQYEANLTSLISEFVLKNIPLNTLGLINISDDEFLKDMLKEYYKTYVLLHGESELVEKLIDNIEKRKVLAFNYVASITEDMFKNPRLRKEFETHMDSRFYIEELKKEILRFGRTQNIIDDSVTEIEVLFDIFSLKAGIGNFLVEDSNNSLTTLKDYMNGSNMDSMCSKKRIDVFVNPVFGDNSVKIKDCILRYCSKN